MHDHHADCILRVWGEMHMLSGLVLTSALVGLVVTGAALALSLPALMALSLYPVVSSLTLLMLATLLYLRTTQAIQPSLLRHQA